MEKKAALMLNTVTNDFGVEFFKNSYYDIKTDELGYSFMENCNGDFMYLECMDREDYDVVIDDMPF